MIAISALISCSENNTNDELDSNELLKKRGIVNLDELSLDEQRNYFKSLNADEKLIIWDNKFNKLISTATNNTEKDYLNKVLVAINNIDLSNNLSDSDYNSIWKPKLEFLKTNFKWTENDINWTFNTLYTVKFKDSFQKNSNRIESGNKKISVSPISSDDCNCKWSWACPGSTECVKNSNCPKDPDDNMGCGWLLFQACTGKCGW